MIIGKTRTNQPVEGDGNAIALELTGKDIAPKDVSSTGTITGNEIVENMSGYAYAQDSVQDLTNEEVYCGVCKRNDEINV